MRLRGALAALLILLGLACGGFPPYETSEQRTPSLPLTRAEQPRSGELTWRPSVLEQTDEGVRFEFVLVNGTKRNYFSVMLRIVLRGPKNEIATVRFPAGAVAADGSRRVRALLAAPGFAVAEADLELLYAQE